ncbi:MAG TPA: hypothetical protein VFH68_21550 [Polyangia bacterium]|nr:hypothetical protein [Polyangia bacterium]
MSGAAHPRAAPHSRDVSRDAEPEPAIAPASASPVAPDPPPASQLRLDAPPRAGRSGQARLTAWLRSRAARDRIVVLEEALLAGTFWRFALRRLAVFGFARGWATALHVLELTFLIEIFAARSFVASLALQNATLIADAFWWGALEALRRRLRAAGPRTGAQVLTTRYLTVAMIAGLLGCGVPLARLAWRWHAGAAPTMLDAYALVCFLRLGLDLVLRALYSGVYAYGRVHRPAWSAVVTSTVLVGLTVALWPWLAGWSFVAALLASVLCSRALLLRFTLRAFRVARVPLPAWRVRRWSARPDWRLLGDSALAGTANLTTRLASVVLLGAVIPSLGAAEGELDVLAYVLHLAAPLILVTCQWGFIFYHDWKRLEADAAALLARRLHAGVLAVAISIAVVAWGATVLLVLVFSGGWWAPVAGVLGALGPAYLGLSLWTGLQLRGFSRGEFTAQAISAGVVIGAAAAVGASAGALLDRTIWYWALAACPWLAIATHALLGRWLRAPRSRSPATLDGWVSLLERARGPIGVWRARLADGRTRAVVDEVRGALAAPGSVVSWRGWLFCFEPAPGAGPAAWMIRCAGLLTRLESISAPDGAAAAHELVRLGWLAAPAPAGDVDALAHEHARLFPGGFILRVGHRPPPAFAGLLPEVRQAIWRDAVRRATGARRHPSPASTHWRVTTLAPEGSLTHVFVAPRIDTAAHEAAHEATHEAVHEAVHEDSPARAWARRLKEAGWHLPEVSGQPVRSRPR